MKKKMKGVVFHGIGDISIEELDVPQFKEPRMPLYELRFRPYVARIFI